MFRGLVAAGLGVLLLVACGSPPVAPHSASSRVACVDAGAPHHAYVVVQHMSGAWLQQCVGFGPDIIDGETIMDRSGIAFDAPRAASTRLMCRVDLEPSADVACDPNHAYWAAFVESRGRWTKLGAFTEARLRDTETPGLHYVLS